MVGSLSALLDCPSSIFFLFAQRHLEKKKQREADVAQTPGEPLEIRPKVHSFQDSTERWLHQEKAGTQPDEGRAHASAAPRHNTPTLHYTTYCVSWNNRSRLSTSSACQGSGTSFGPRPAHAFSLRENFDLRAWRVRLAGLVSACDFATRGATRLKQLETPGRTREALRTFVP